MGRVILNILRILVKTVLAAALFVCVWTVLSPYFRIQKNIEGDAFRNIPANTLDAVAVVSSHIQYAFDPAVFYTESGYYSYVMGSQCQPMAITYHMLEEIFKTQSPQVVFIDVFTLLPASSVCYAEGNYYVAIDEMTGENRLKAADTVPDEQLSLQYKFDLLMNHSNWKTMDLKDITSILKNGKPYDDYNYELGYVRQEPYDIRPTPLYVYQRENTVVLSETEKQRIDDVISLCLSHDAVPFFLKTPFICDQENTDKLYAVWDYLDEKNVRYEDYIQRAEELEWFMDMDGDTWHNNSWGARIVTEDLARITKEEGLVTDHRTDETMEYLCNNMRLITVKSLMNKNNININNLLELAAKYPCAAAIRYRGYQHTTIGEKENRLLQGLGTDHDFIGDCAEDYYGFFENGRLIRESSEPFSLEYGGSEVVFTEDEILIDGAGQDPEPGEMEIYFMANNFDWLNAIGIDYSTRWFWENSCDGYSCTIRCGW